MWVEKFSNNYATSGQLDANGIEIYKQVGKPQSKEPPKWVDIP